MAGCFGNNPEGGETGVPAKPVLYYKGMDENFKCRGFQFEVGKTYKHDGEVEVCSSGFHSCSNPWDVLNYYDVTSRFALVEVVGETATHSGDTKIASSEITIKKELKLPEFIDYCISFIKNSGMPHASIALENDSNLAASGYDSNLAASGYGSKLAASGSGSKLAASGYGSKLAASGHYSNLAASGRYSNLAASGHYSNLAASGRYSNLAASGHYSNLAASGNGNKLAASGNGSSLAASGNGSSLAALGYGNNLAASGDNSIAVCVGTKGKVKGGLNCALALTRWVESEKRYRITTAYVGEDGIKADTWYSLNNDGKFIEQGE